MTRLVAPMLLALLAAAAAARGQVPPGPPAEPDPPGIRPTQLAVSFRKGNEEIRFRATVLAKGRDSLILLTAAHCLGPADVGVRLRLARGDSAVEVPLAVVVRNPSYGSNPGLEIPGADNALAQLTLAPDDPEQRAFVDRLEVATMSVGPVPGPDGETIPIYSIDQFERAHGVKAGNYANPKWLQWGAGYRPIPGDSGSGVFAYRRSDAGPPVPVLIGVVTDRDPMGGGASVICRRHRWVAEALGPEAAPPASAPAPGR